MPSFCHGKSDRALTLYLPFTHDAPSPDFISTRRFGNGLRMDSLKGDFQVESAVSDDLTVGLNLDNDSDSPLRSIYGKIASK